MNIVAYIRRFYISRLLHQLTEEYNVCSSVITNECFNISCSVPGRWLTLRKSVSSPLSNKRKWFVERQESYIERMLNKHLVF
jgi:hypothetical protein